MAAKTALDFWKHRLCCCLYKDDTKTAQKYHDNLAATTDEHPDSLVITQQPAEINAVSVKQQDVVIDRERNSSPDAFDEIDLDERQLTNRDERGGVGDETINVTGLMLDQIYERDEIHAVIEDYVEPEQNVVEEAIDEDDKLSQTAGVHRLNLVEAHETTEHDEYRVGNEISVVTSHIETEFITERSAEDDSTESAIQIPDSGRTEDIESERSDKPTSPTTRRRMYDGIDTDSDSDASSTAWSEALDVPRHAPPPPPPPAN